MTHTIAIIGAGFSGTVLAARLLRAQAAAGASAVAGLKIVLINRVSPSGADKNIDRDNLGRGLAYGTKSDAHLLNVPAGRMSAFPEDENDFLNFLEQRGLKTLGGAFVSRRWYGEYLRHTLDAAMAISAGGGEGTRVTSGAAHSAIDIISGEVNALRMMSDSSPGRAVLTFTDGRTLTADRVVLALGNFAPANPLPSDAIAFTSPRYIRDPWAADALDLVDGTRPIVLIGTGLTMFDVVLSLSATWPQATFTAFSRRGLLPQAHREATLPPQFNHAPERILEGPATARAYVRALRVAVAGYAQQEGDWRDVVASLRPLTPALWQRLPTLERTRLLRHARPHWESHRHRAAPVVARTIESLMADKRLIVIAARLTSMTANDDGLRLTLRRRHHTQTEALTAATVINCTGPTSDYRLAQEVLLLNLHAQGLITPDQHRLGIEVNEQLQVIDTHGHAMPSLYCVGPLLKARFWEATAVPELRENVRVAAQALLQSLKPHIDEPNDTA